MDQIDIQIMTWHMSPYWLDTWHNIDVTRGMNNLKKNSKIQKNEKMTRGISLTPLTPY